MRDSLLRGLTRPTVLALAAGILAAVGSACTAVNVNAITEVTGPDYGQFSEVSSSAGGMPVDGVSVVLERRCGTLDCHGQVGRPLRIYGQYGLRFKGDAGSVPGVQSTTATEHEANYQSVIGLQPELMTEVVQGNAPPEDLMLLRKPLQLERHKGGAVFVDGDDAETCLRSWLAGQTNFTACTAAVAQ
jgi:hypothetical protein